MSKVGRPKKEDKDKKVKYGISIDQYLFDKMKNEDNIIFVQGDYSVKYCYDVSEDLTRFKEVYEQWIINNGFDLNKIKLLTAIIFLNMSPLHDGKFGNMLWFKSIEMLYDCNK